MVSVVLCLSINISAWSPLVCDCLEVLVHDLREYVSVYKCWCMVSINLCLSSSVGAWSQLVGVCLQVLVRGLS